MAFFNSGKTPSRKLLKTGPAIILSCVAILIFLAAFTVFYSRIISGLLYREAKSTMMEITEQAAGRINAMMMGDIRSVTGFAEYLNVESSRGENIAEKIRLYSASFLQTNSFGSVCVSGRDGNAFCSDGRRIDISEEPCFRASINGGSCLSSPFSDPDTGSPMISVTAPIIYNGGVGGVVRAARFSEELYAVFNIPFYGGRGYSYVLGRDGGVILGSVRKFAGSDYGNIFEILIENGNEGALVERIRYDISRGRRGATSIISGGESKLISYMPFSVNTNWYILSVVPESVILENARKIVVLTLVLCGLINLLIAAGFIYRLIIRRRQQKHIEILAYRDPLTGLYNKNYMDEYSVKILAAPPGVKYASVSADINRFKAVNDLLGYGSGNEVLTITGNILKSSMRPGEMAARINNDIFCLFLMYDDKPELVRRINNIFDKIKEELDRELFGGKITFACGVYLVNDRETASAKVYDNADVARKSAKSGTGSWLTFYRPSMTAKLKNEKEIEDAMERALENEEFLVYLQPKISLETGKIMGAEALVRWDRPLKGLTFPNDFIPLFEKNGFVTKLDFYMFDKLCAAVKKMKDNGEPVENIVVSVNMSRHHLRQNFFVETLSLIAEKHGARKENIEIEITENAFFDDGDLLVSILSELKGEGFKLSMDDFGSGYSSLNLLKKIPIDVLKIDKEFLNESETSEKSRAIIASIVDMARRINVKVVCEGVETKSQESFLRSIGCDYAQGYLYSKPIPIEDFIKFLRKNLG